jgi:hypothetical protein
MKALKPRGQTRPLCDSLHAEQRLPTCMSLFVRSGRSAGDEAGTGGSVAASVGHPDAGAGDVVRDSAKKAAPTSARASSSESRERRRPRVRHRRRSSPAADQPHLAEFAPLVPCQAVPLARLRSIRFGRKALVPPTRIGEAVGELIFKPRRCFADIRDNAALIHKLQEEHVVHVSVRPSQGRLDG